jgi:hypothetical protein
MNTKIPLCCGQNQTQGVFLLQFGDFLVHGGS